MNEEKSQAVNGLVPLYQTYERQKCFIAYTEQTEWSDDLLSACQEVLSQQEFNLEPDYARKHFDPNVTLRQKALELVANARYGIYDLSCWRDKKGAWQMPRNVFIELGIAIALNRPTLLLRHANNRELELPECLQSVSEYILEFSGETTLKRALIEHLPQWVKVPPKQNWWNRYCIFGSRTCEYREAHPHASQWGQKTLRCHVSDGPDVDRDDFRGVVEDVLGRFSDVTLDYLDAPSLTQGYEFLLCTHCQIVRSTPFAIYRLTPCTPSETFIAIGMSIALEAQFEYKILKILLTRSMRNVPSLLSGYEVVVARNDKERKSRLRTFAPATMRKVRKTMWKPRPLPFIEVFVHSCIEPVTSAIDQTEAQALEQKGESFKAAELWMTVGEPERAAAQYEAAGAWQQAIELWESLGRPLKHAGALEQHARSLTDETHSDQDRAAAWSAAAQALEAEGETERAATCHRESCRCLQLPIITLDVQHEGLVLEEWSRLEFTVRNEGFGTARNILTRASGEQLEGQVMATQRIVTLRPGREHSNWLDVRPLQRGEAVPLRLRVDYQDSTQDRVLEQTVYLPVASTHADRGAAQVVPINTGGGTVVTDTVKVAGGDFIGRDQRADTPASRTGPPPDAAPDLTPSPQANQLHRILSHRLNLDEFRTLCFYLGVNYDHLRGEGLPAKARELLLRLQRRNALPQLTDWLRRARPDIELNIPSDPNIQSPIPNPFGDAGRITASARFFDRQELLRQIFEELNKGVNLSLVGPAQIGKSSLLSMVCEEGPRRVGLPRDAFTYLSLQWVSDEDESYAALCDALGLPTPLRGYELSHALRGQRRVLCLDEIEKMAWEGFTVDLHSHLRDLADGPNAPLKLVIASRSPLARLFPNSPELDSPLSDICRQLDVGPFPPDVARAFLAHRLRGGSVIFSENEINSLLAQAGGHPAQLQRAAAALYDSKVELET